jgi:hypothetical protein
MPKIRIKHHALDQNQVMFYGRRVAYCGQRPLMPVCFLIDEQCPLDDEQKTEVIKAVWEQIGQPKKTKQTEPYWPNDIRTDD